MAGCDGDEQQQPAARINLERLSGRSVGAAALLTDRLNQTMVITPARKFQAGLLTESRIGQIEIPRLGVREWVIQGTSKEALEKGAGHIEGTSIPGLGGNFAIAGDRVLYSAPFLRLDQVAEGDEMLIHMPYADFTYRVEAKTNVAPTEVSVLQPRGYDSVTLATCDPPWQMQTRIIIFARLAGTAPKVVAVATKAPAAANPPPDETNSPAAAIPGA